MKIELLYFDGCPNWQAVLEEIKGLLTAKGLDDQVDLIQVASNQEAESLEFPGSPTIRIDGEDVELDISTSSFQLACRIYEVDGKLQGMPPKEWIDAALDAAAAFE